MVSCYVIHFIHCDEDKQKKHISGLFSIAHTAVMDGVRTRILFCCEYYVIPNQDKNIRVLPFLSGGDCFFLGT